MVVIFEDFTTGRRAQQVCLEIAQAIHCGCASRVGAWTFQMLKVPTLSTLAAQEAAQADLLVLAPHDASALPPEILKWVQSFLRPRSIGPRALLVLSGVAQESDEPESPLKGQLQELADQFQLPFRLLHLEWPGTQWDEPAYAENELVAVASTFLQATQT